MKSQLWKNEKCSGVLLWQVLRYNSFAIFLAAQSSAAAHGTPLLTSLVNPPHSCCF